VTLLATSNPPPQVVHTLVAAYRRHEGDEVALEQVRGLAAIFKYRPVFQRVAAELCAGMGFRAEAIQRYARYMRLEPSDWEALQVLVALCRDAGELSACHAYLQRYVEANPDHLAGLRELARAALDNDRPADAHAAALRVVDLSPADPAGYRLLADALAALSGPPKAVIALRARAQQSSDPAPQVGLAYAYVLNGEPGQALALLSAAAETRRTEAEAAYVRGVAKDALGLHDEAVIELARAASSLTAPADYRAMLAATLATAGRPEDALWEYSFLLNSPASEARGISGVRQLLAARAVEPEAACEALRRVGVDRGPSRALVGLLSDVLCKAAPSDTIVALNDICDVWRNSEMAADALARAYQELNQPDQEARALTRLVDMRPANVGYQLRLARAHERAEAPSRAADAYGMVLAFDPRNREAQDALDRLLAQERTPPPAPPPVQPVARPPIPRLADPPSSRAILAPT
jgi:predicted Zn-dependent protease